MRRRLRARPTHALIALLVMTAACGKSTPTGPEPAPTVLTLGPQFILISQDPSTPGCGSTNVTTALTLTWSGAEWIAAASGPEAGTVELHFRESGSAAGNGPIPVTGTIKGTATHLPQFLGGVPPYVAQLDFGSDGRTTVSGTIIPPGTTTPYPFAIVEAHGTGSATATDGAGTVCAGTSFGFTLAPLTSNP